MKKVIIQNEMVYIDTFYRGIGKRNLEIYSVYFYKKAIVDFLDRYNNLKSFPFRPE